MVTSLVIIACGFLLLLGGCASAGCSADTADETFAVTITKGMCFGRCPVYDATVRGNQSITYIGKTNVERPGTWYAKATSEDVCYLLTEVRERNIMRLDTSYMEPVADAPVTTLAVTMKGHTRTFRWNLGTPEPLKGIVARMVALTHENTSLSQP